LISKFLYMSIEFPFCLILWLKIYTRSHYCSFASFSLFRSDRLFTSSKNIKMCNYYCSSYCVFWSVTFSFFCMPSYKRIIIISFWLSFTFYNNIKIFFEK
jgi:hypothetical protein